MRETIVTVLGLLLVAATAAAQQPHQHQPGHQHGAPGDSAFRHVQERGAVVMGVDQYATTHRFEDLPDGGRIVFEADPADTAAVAQIRRHLRDIARRFQAGDFSAPDSVHAREVPGTRTLAARRDRVRYQMTERPGGGEVRLSTADPDALAAIREFLAFQRDDHRAGS